MSAIRLFVSNSMRGVMDELVPRFRQSAGHEVSISYDPAKVMMERIRKGESADLAILGGSAIEDLEKMGKIAPGSRRAVASCGIGVAVAARAPRPDIGTVDSFKRALLAAKSIAYTEQGASGMYFSKLIESLGIAGPVKARAVRRPGGLIGELVAAGEAEMAIQQISALKPYSGIEIVGPLPDELQLVTILSAGIGAAGQSRSAVQEMIRYFGTPEAKAVLAAKGLEPGKS